MSHIISQNDWKNNARRLGESRTEIPVTSNSRTRIPCLWDDDYNWRGSTLKLASSHTKRATNVYTGTRVSHNRVTDRLEHFPSVGVQDDPTYNRDYYLVAAEN